MSDSPPANLQLDTLDYPSFGYQNDDSQAENRSCQRRPVFALRRIAPLTGSSKPDDAEFFCVESRDLTVQGFSFFMASAPTFSALVLAVDGSPTVEYATAEVVHCMEVWVYPSGLVEPIDVHQASALDHDLNDEGGQRMVLVGCRFV